VTGFVAATDYSESFRLRHTPLPLRSPTPKPLAKRSLRLTFAANIVLASVSLLHCTQGGQAAFSRSHSRWINAVADYSECQRIIATRLLITVNVIWGRS